MTPTGNYEFSPGALRDLKRLEPDVRHRVFDALERLVGEPPRGDVKKLQGVSGEWRLRVGDWRVRFTRDETSGVPYVLSIETRGRAYR